jgi:hypothetical protein
MIETLTIDATFENGVFVPKRPIHSIRNRQDVKLNVEVETSEASRPLSEAFFVDDCISAPIDLPYIGESRLVEVIRGGEREIDPAALAELIELQCSQE